MVGGQRACYKQPFLIILLSQPPYMVGGQKERNERKKRKNSHTYIFWYFLVFIFFWDFRVWVFCGGIFCNESHCISIPKYQSPSLDLHAYGLDAQSWHVLDHVMAIPILFLFPQRPPSGTVAFRCSNKIDMATWSLGLGPQSHMNSNGM